MHCMMTLVKNVKIEQDYILTLFSRAFTFTIQGHELPYAPVCCCDAAEMFINAKSLQILALGTLMCLLCVFVYFLM